MGTQSWTKGRGPLVPFSGRFRARLLERGHAKATVKRHLVLMGQLNRWLTAQGLGAEELTSEVAQRFLASRRAGGQRRVPTLASLMPLFDYLRELSVLPAEPRADLTPQDELLAGYRRYLTHDRGLSATTIWRYENFARRFLAERARCTKTETGIEQLTGAGVNAYLLEVSTRPDRGVGQERGRRSAGAAALFVCIWRPRGRPRHGDASRSHLERHSASGDDEPHRRRKAARQL